MEDFLRSQPAFTPLVAGATTTMITGTLVSQFGFPGSWTSIIVSLTLAFLVPYEKSVPFLKRGIFLLINSITIFSVAMGINAAGVAATQAPPQHVERGIPAESEAKPFFDEWF